MRIYQFYPLLQQKWKGKYLYWPLFQHAFNSSPRNEASNLISGTSVRRSTRISLRHRSGSPAGLFRPSLVTNQSKATRKSSLPNPFSALLREKRLAEKHGHGNKNVFEADLTALQYSKDSLADAMDEEKDGDPSEWGLNISSPSIRGILTSRPQRRDDPDLTLEDEGRERILEDEGGKTILDILEKDKTERRNLGRTDKSTGIQLWRTESESSVMALDEQQWVPGNSPYIRLLNCALQRGGSYPESSLHIISNLLLDMARFRSLLNMHLMLSVSPAERAGLATYLCEIGMNFLKYNDHLLISF